MRGTRGVLAEAVGRMNAEAVALFVLAGCAVGGAIGVGGVVLGLLLGRRFRERPRVRCVATDWRLDFQKEGSVPRVVCSFELDLFNEGRLATGIRGVSVALYGEGVPVVIGRLKDSASGEPLWAIDLPPRKWAHASARVLFEGEEARELGRFRRANLFGRFPDGEVFELGIIERGDFVASPKRATSEREDHIAKRNFRSRLLGRRRRAG